MKDICNGQVILLFLDSVSLSEKQRSHPTGELLSIPVIIDLQANQTNGLGELVPLGVHVAKAMHGGSLPQTGLEHQVQVSELLLQPFILLLLKQSTGIWLAWLPA